MPGSGVTPMTLMVGNSGTARAVPEGSCGGSTCACAVRPWHNRRTAAATGADEKTIVRALPDMLSPRCWNLLSRIAARPHPSYRMAFECDREDFPTWDTA